MSVIHWSLRDEVECHPGHMRKQVSYDTCHVALHRYLPGGGGYDEHQHPELQAGVILLGQMAMTFPDGPRRLETGELYVIPGEVPHGGKGDGPTGALVVNLYLRPHLMAAEGNAIAFNDTEGLRDGRLATTNATIQRFDLPAGATLAGSEDAVADEFDILLDGAASYGAAADTLSRFDVVRRDEGRSELLRAGADSGATIVRISIPRHLT